MKREQSPAPHKHDKLRVRTVVAALDAHMVRVMVLWWWEVVRMSPGTVRVRLRWPAFGP